MTAIEGDWAALAKLVRERRRELGIPTQQAAAELSSISKNTWQRLENGQPVGQSSLNSVADVLKWHASYVMAILREGENAPKHVVATATAALPGFGAHAHGHVAEPEVRQVSLEDSVTVREESVVARPETVRGYATIPGPAVVREAPGRIAPNRSRSVSVNMSFPGEQSDDWSILTISVPIARDVFAELDKDAVDNIVKLMVRHTRQMVELAVGAVRQERARRGFESTSEWPEMGEPKQG